MQYRNRNMWMKTKQYWFISIILAKFRYGLIQKSKKYETPSNGKNQKTQKCLVPTRVLLFNCKKKLLFKFFRIKFNFSVFSDLIQMAV